MGKIKLSSLVLYCNGVAGILVFYFRPNFKDKLFPELVLVFLLGPNLYSIICFYTLLPELFSSGFDGGKMRVLDHP